MANRNDDFNRANGAIGTPSDGGSAWESLQGVWSVVSNQAGNDGALGDEGVVLQASSAVVTVTVTFATHTSSGGIIVRASDQSNYFLIHSSQATGTFVIFRKQSGTYTEIQSGGARAVSGDVVKVTVTSGNLISVYKNDVFQTSVTDAFNSTATKHGIRSGGDSAFRFDSFSITDDSGGGGGTTISLTPATFSFIPKNFQPKRTTTLSAQTFNFTENPFELTLGGAVQFTAAAFNFTENPIVIVQGVDIQLVAPAIATSAADVGSGISASVGSPLFNFTENSLTLTYNNTRVPNPGTVSFGGYSPAVLRKDTIAPFAGSLATLGYQPGLTRRDTIVPGVGGLLYTGSAPAVFGQGTIVPSEQNLDLSGYTPVVTQQLSVVASTGIINSLGYAPALSIDPVARLVVPLTGSLVFSGRQPEGMYGVFNPKNKHGWVLRWK